MLVDGVLISDDWPRGFSTARANTNFDTLTVYDDKAVETRTTAVDVDVDVDLVDSGGSMTKDHSTD